MLKINDIKLIDNHKILCFFNTGEKRIFNVTSIINEENKFSIKLNQPHIFKKAKVGLFGEIYWDGIAEMKDYEGKTIPCEYDISPEFVYQNSDLFSEIEN
jgi:hypothetical protein